MCFSDYFIFPPYVLTQISVLYSLYFQNSLFTFVVVLLPFGAVLRMLYQPKMSVFDILAMRLNNQLIILCV